MFVVDTNILMYAAGTDSPFHDRCRSQPEEWRRQPAAWYITWGIAYEFLRVTTHQRVFKTPWSLLGRHLVDIADREALYGAMEGR